MAPSVLDGSFLGLAHPVFDLGEDLLDRIEVRAVGRQQEAVGASVSDCATDGLAFVAAKIVEHDDIAGAQCRGEELDHPGEEDGSVDRTVDDAGRNDAVDA